MTKKRQQDFGKVHLKPGRLLSKRKNITPTNFKSKKIIMPKEKIVKPKSDFTISDCIRKIKSCGSEKDKIAFLNELNKLIHRQSDTLNMHLSQVFQTVLVCIRDPNDGIRSAALKATVSVLEITDDLYLHSYADLINNSISAIMKNPNQKIVPASLILLDCMLKNHPDLICHNMNILFDLIPPVRKHYTRKIIAERETYKYSERDDINALGHINAFLKSMLRNKSDLLKNEDDDKDVYMDGKGSLSLEIYAGSGLQPIDIEAAYSKQFDQQTNHFDEVKKLEIILDALLKLIPNYFCQIVGSESNADDNTFRCDPIADLSIIIQLLCNVAELAEKNSDDDDEEEFENESSKTIMEKKEIIASFLKEKVFSSHRKRFPFDLHTVFVGTSLLPLALLNTSLCFLFMKFLSSNDLCDDDGILIEKYLRKFFSLEKTYSSEIKCQCIPLFVKMIQLYSYKRDVPEVVFFLLKQLVLLLKTRINHPNKKMLINLLFNMSFHPAYRFWIDTEPMELWYEWLLSHLKENINKLDKNLMKIIKKIAKLRHSSFLNHLDFTMIRPLLKHRNDDLKETAIFLLHNMDIDNELLQNIFDIICLDSFPKKFTVNLIYLLQARFLQYPTNQKAYVDYIEFLLNVAVDSNTFLSNRMVDFETNEYTKAIQQLEEDWLIYVFPSLHWKEHSKVFEVCQLALRNLPQDVVNIVQRKALTEMLNHATKIPIHCAMALLKLDIPKSCGKSLRMLMHKLNMSCLLTMSILTQMPMDDEWYKWNVCELMNNVMLTEDSVCGSLDLLEKYLPSHPSGILVYHILRVLQVFIRRKLVDFENQEIVESLFQLFQFLEDHCADRTMPQQPCYIQVYNLWTKNFM